MSDRKIIDEKISRLVRSVEADVPASLESRIRAAAARTMPSPSGRQEKQRLLWPALVAGAAAALLTVVALWRAPQAPSRPPISEIRTEFEIADKNITIIFIQKPDFKLIH